MLRLVLLSVVAVLVSMESCEGFKMDKIARFLGFKAKAAVPKPDAIREPVEIAEQALAETPVDPHKKATFEQLKKLGHGALLNSPTPTQKENIESLYEEYRYKKFDQGWVNVDFAHTKARTIVERSSLDVALLMNHTLGGKITHELLGRTDLARQQRLTMIQDEARPPPKGHLLVNQEKEYEGKTTRDEDYEGAVLPSAPPAPREEGFPFAGQQHDALIAMRYPPQPPLDQKVEMDGGWIYGEGSKTGYE